MPKIAFTGGGTAGHVTPNMALIDVLRAEHWNIFYIGSENGVEKSMMQTMNIAYFGIKCGKLRRYFSLKNFYDPFNLIIGIIQAYFILLKQKPDIIFSKGGFVALPVVISAKLRHIPVIAHESDMTPGLANRLSFPFINHLCVSFDQTKKHFTQQNKVTITGTPIRAALMNGNKAHGLSMCGFTSNKPCLLIIGGSQGSKAINNTVRASLAQLCERFQIIHLCGKGNIDNALIGKDCYVQIEYAASELPDLFAASDIIISRAGANALYEILALNKPHILIPLSMRASRGDQIQNAKYFAEKGISVVIQEDELTKDTLINALDNVQTNSEAIIKLIRTLNTQSATTKIVTIIKNKIYCSLSNFK